MTSGNFETGAVGVVGTILGSIVLGLDMACTG
jgi:hypothetical protein